MSLLDTFTILFDADTSSIEQGAQRSDAAADELLKTLQDTDRVADSAGSSFAGYATKALGALGAALSVGTAINNAIARASDIHLMNQTSESIGVAVEEMDAFRRAVEDTGGSSEGAQGSVAKMAKSMGAALDDVNSSQAKAFAGLGISLKGVDGQSKDAITGILEVAAAVEGMDKNKARFAIQELGIRDSKTVELILKGRKEIEKMTQAHKDQGVVSKESAIMAGKLDDAMNKLRGGLDRAGLGMTNALMPALITGYEWLGKIVEWGNKNSTFLTGVFIGIGAAVAYFCIPPMIAWAAATLAATWPIIAIGAAIAAVSVLFGLAYDDIMNFIDGNDSLIGQVFEQYPMVKDAVFMVIDAFKMLGDVVSAIWTMLIAGFQQVIDFVMTGVRQIANGISTVASFFGIGSDADQPDESGAVDRGEDSVSVEQRPARPSGSGQSAEDVPMVPGTENGVSTAKAAFAGVEAGRAAMTAANASPLNATTSNAISNSATSNRETNVQVGEITVNTQATDAKGVASEVGGELTAQLKQLDSEYSSGVDR